MSILEFKASILCFNISGCVASRKRMSYQSNVSGKLLKGDVKDMLGENVVPKSRSTPMSLNTIQFEVKHYWKILQEQEAELSDAYGVFAGEREIWPDQCMRIAGLLHNIGEPVHSFCLLLENPASLPASDALHRYLLLASLQRMDEQIEVLISLIAKFRSMRQASLKQANRHRRDIENRLQLLGQECSKTLENIPPLFEQAHFLERKILQFPGNQRSLDLAQQGKQADHFLTEQNDSDLAREVHFCENQGILHGELGKKEYTLEYFKQALKLVKKVKDPGGEGWALFYISLLSFEKNHYREALATSLLARKIIRDVQSSDYEKLQEQITFLHRRISRKVGKPHFIMLLQDIEPKAQQIIEQQLRERNM